MGGPAHWLRTRRPGILRSYLLWGAPLGALATVVAGMTPLLREVDTRRVPNCVSVLESTFLVVGALVVARVAWRRFQEVTTQGPGEEGVSPWEALDELGWLLVPAFVALAAGGATHLQVTRLAEEVGPARVVALRALVSCVGRWPSVEAALEGTQGCPPTFDGFGSPTECHLQCPAVEVEGEMPGGPGFREILAAWSPRAEDENARYYGMNNLQRVGRHFDPAAAQEGWQGAIGAGWMVISATLMAARSVRTITTGRTGWRRTVAMGILVGSAALWLALGVLSGGDLLGSAGGGLVVVVAGILAVAALPLCLATMAWAAWRGRAGVSAALATGAAFPALAAAQVVLFAVLSPKEGDIHLHTLAPQVAFFAVAAQLTHLVHRRLLRVPTVT